MKKLKSCSGQTIVEYALILSFIAVVAISVLIAMTPDPKKNTQEQSQTTTQQTTQDSSQAQTSASNQPTQKDPIHGWFVIQGPNSFFTLEHPIHTEGETEFKSNGTDVIVYGDCIVKEGFQQ